MAVVSTLRRDQIRFLDRVDDVPVTPVKSER